MLKSIGVSFLLLCVLSSNIGCTTSFLSPADGMSVKEPKIRFKKTRTSLEAEASSNFTGDIDFKGKYNKLEGDFEGSLVAHVNSDASTVVDSQVEKIKALEAAYGKYSDNMTALGIAQAQAWQQAFSNLTQVLPGIIGGSSGGGGSNQKPDPFATVLSLWGSLTPEQKTQFIARLSGSQ